MEIDIATEICPDQTFYMWGDCDIPYLQKITDPSQMKKAMNGGVLFSKIGAKITETSQPLDLYRFSIF